MAKRKKEYSEHDRVSDWLSSLKYKDLKRAAIMRGFPFRLIGSSVQELESFVYNHYYDRVNPNKLAEFDEWNEKTLIEEGAIELPIHLDLKLGFYATDDKGNEKRRRRDPNLMGVVKTKEEVATFKPRKGSKKTLVFDLMDKGMPTREIIDLVQESYPDTTDGTIKVWCSQARKKLKAKNELGI